jgi:hypothetical protein
VSHDLLHHAEPKLFFDLMHMFELFEFVVKFELSSLEKIKRKAIINSEKKGKLILAQSSPSKLPRARSPPSNKWPPPIGASPRPHAPLSPSRCPVGPTCQHQSPLCTTPSLAVPWAPLVNPTARSLTHSLCSVGPTCRNRPPEQPALTTACFPAMPPRV